MAFDSWLAALDHDVVELSGQVTRAVHDAGQAALQADLGLAEAALGSMADISAGAHQVSDQAAAVMARQQPVAQDLRRLLGTQRNAASLEQLGQLAADVAKLTRRRYPRTVVPTEVYGVVVDMTALADRLTGLVSQTLQTGHLGNPGSVIRVSEQMAALHREMLTIVRSTAWPHDVATAVDMSLLSLELLRMAECGLDVAGSVLYVETGTTDGLRRGW